MKVRGLIIGALAALVAASVAVFGGTASAAQSQPPRSPVAQGTGGGAATMSPYATSAAINVLKHGEGRSHTELLARAATLEFNQRGWNRSLRCPVTIPAGVKEEV